MSVTNVARDKLASGHLSLGVGVRTTRSVEIAKMMATAGFDWLFLDMEHGTMSLDACAQISAAALDAGIAPIARVPNGQYSIATRALDNGALGIVMPHVDTAAEAREIVSKLKYPPIGYRSVGGWGPLLADEGSGHWIGVRALRGAIREHDEQGSSMLLNRLAAQWKADTLEQMVEIAHSTPPPDFAALTRTVVEVAAQGNALAQAVLVGGGRALGEDASLALRKVLALEPAAPRRVAFTGSVLENITMVREAMFAEIERQYPGTQVLANAVDPTEGALWRARQNLQEAP